MKKRAETVAQRIRDDIVSGAFPFGYRLTFGELAERYGTSHMPIREALKELQGEGLVVGEPNRGSRVRTVDPRFVENVFDMRNALEVAMTHRVALRATPALAQRLEEIESLFEKAVGRKDYSDALAINREFHQTIYAEGDNPDASALIERHWLLIGVLWRVYGYGADRFSGVISDHRYLIRAIARRDGSAASAIMAAHVVKAKQELLDRMFEAEKPEMQRQAKVNRT